ncbi:virulence factor BrkB family protein [Ningiella sp. W23]|uniref:virulence factor BrkB family protein n=1 Tax=Ningiella sp. W23 TaxID=3023715 RepID=UPI00375646DC
MSYSLSAKAYYEARKPLVIDILKTFLRHLKSERITVSSGHMAFVSLLALVPVIMVFFMIMSAFPAFSEIRTLFEDFIFSNFLPASGDVMQTHIGEFVSNASGMGAVGIGSLLVVSLLLISNIDKTLNHLWQAKADRPLVYTFAIYWMVITLGPLLIGVSIAVSSYLGAIASFADDYTPGFGTAFLKLVPSIAAVGAFMILYMVVPNRPVRAKYAIWGAVLAAVLFEVSKKAFAFYVASFPSYQIIYGALAVVPILFMWVYLCWIVVFLGAVFSFAITTTCERYLENEKQENQQLSGHSKSEPDSITKRELDTRPLSQSQVTMIDGAKAKDLEVIAKE